MALATRTLTRRRLRKHFGPGPHPGTGTPQTVHSPGVPSNFEQGKQRSFAHVQRYKAFAEMDDNLAEMGVEVERDQFGFAPEVKEWWERVVEGGGPIESEKDLAILNAALDDEYVRGLIETLPAPPPPPPPEFTYQDFAQGVTRSFDEATRHKALSDVYYQALDRSRSQGLQPYTFPQVVGWWTDSVEGGDPLRYEADFFLADVAMQTPELRELLQGVQKHMGPGPHPSGSPQSVHGGSTPGWLGEVSGLRDQLRSDPSSADSIRDHALARHAELSEAFASASPEQQSVIGEEMHAYTTLWAEADNTVDVGTPTGINQEVLYDRWYEDYAIESEAINRARQQGFHFYDPNTGSITYTPYRPRTPLKYAHLDPLVDVAFVGDKPDYGLVTDILPGSVMFGPTGPFRVDQVHAPDPIGQPNPLLFTRPRPELPESLTRFVGIDGQGEQVVIDLPANGIAPPFIAQEVVQDVLQADPTFNFLKAEVADQAAVDADNLYHVDGISHRTGGRWLKQVVKHDGPGPHESGSPQTVHGNRESTDPGPFIGPVRVFDPPQIVTEAVDEWFERTGRPRPEIDWATVSQDHEFQMAVAQAYDAMPEQDPAAAASYLAFGEEIEAQFQFLTEEVGIEFQSVDYDPYRNAFQAATDLAENNRLLILSTETTGGHPLFSNEVNDHFRFVHDIFGHIATGRDFDRHGEEAAYLHHAAMFSDAARPAMTSETRGQTASLIANGEFPPQKVALLPEWAYEAQVLKHMAGRHDQRDHGNWARGTGASQMLTQAITSAPAFSGERGATKYIPTGDEPSSGFALGITSRSQRFTGPPSARKVRQFIRANRDLLSQPGHYLGFWENPDGVWFLDVSQTFPTAGEAFEAYPDEEAVFDFATFETVYNPRLTKVA